MGHYGKRCHKVCHLCHLLSVAPSVSAVSNHQWYTLFFHKQHFYKQHEAQNGQKFSKNFKQNPEAQFLVLVIKQQVFSLKSLP